MQSAESRSETVVVTVSRDPQRSLQLLGDGDLARGQRALARLLWGALEETDYASLPDYASIEALSRGDLAHLAQLPEDSGAVLVLGALEGRLVGAFWGYELAAAPGVCPELRQRARLACAHASARAAGLDRFGASAATRASADELRQLAEEMGRARPGIFYADWLAVSREHRGRGIGRELWSRGLDEGLADGRFDAYISRTIDGNRGFFERFYCRHMGGRALFSWSSDGLQRIAFGGRR